MTISVWRYSHLTLAVSSFLLLTLASITGIILAFKPISDKIQPYRSANFSETTLAQSLPVLRKVYPDISELSIDANDFVLVKGTDANGENLLAYVDPQTGKIIGFPKPENEFFQWVTALHRSLFIHETGRFFIGVTCFLLLLITVSGTMLILQRQRGLKRFFTSIARDNFAQYYHVVLGRLSLIPIFIIAISGTYLSLARFGLIDVSKTPTKIDFDAIRSAPINNPADFKIFKEINLADVESVEFPFSEDAEDYYTLKLKNEEITVNQITGDVLSDVKYPKAEAFTNLSLDLHTGRTNWIWALILAIASGNILFFIYSGFAITLKRRANRVKNKFKAAESGIIILVGSENGSTYAFAKALHVALLKQGKKAFIGELNQYTVFAKAEHLIIITATYGLGEAPTNAEKFNALVEKYPQMQPIQFSVLGLGSHAYPDFCKYAFEVNQLLSHQAWAKQIIDIHTINDKSPDEFSLWAEAWSQQTGISLELLLELKNLDKKPLHQFTVNSNTKANSSNGTFIIKLSKPKGKVHSGDLLAIYPENNHRERLYSIGVIDNEIQLSVRLHENGLGSNYLNELKANENISARIVKNQHFYFPKKASAVVMISNGTGIAPFLGMISQNKSQTPIHLYCGFRSADAYSVYDNFLKENKASKKLSHVHTAFSREGDKQYVSNLIVRDTDLIAEVLQQGGVIMICGSLTMQKDLLEILETICQNQTDKELSYYQSREQIRTDCY